MNGLIYADELIRRFENHKRLYCKNRIEYLALSDKEKAMVDELDNCIAEILNAQTIEAEPKWIRETGHWIIWYEEEETSAGLETRPKCKCSVCGKYIKAHEAKSTNYCSNCGAYNGGNTMVMLDEDGKPLLRKG